jgi:nucleotide-binding universal stress UspA family protein
MTNPRPRTRPGERRTPATSVGLHRIVVATDFDLEGDRAIRRAVRLPLAAKATVVIVHVLPASIPLSASSVVAGAADQELQAARIKLIVLLERRGRHDVEVRTRLTSGNAAAEIARVAHTGVADLVVVGRGRSRLSGTLLGTTAQWVARHARVPVLLVRQPPVAPYRRVVLGFDGSPDARHAARLTRAVIATPATVFSVFAFEDPRDDLAPILFKAAARARWKAFAPKLALESRRIRKLLEGIDPRRHWSLSFKPGDPRYQIVDSAKKKRADLIIVGSQSRSGLPRFILGSVAEAVLNQATCDVLIAPRQHLAF